MNRNLKIFIQWTLVVAILLLVLGVDLAEGYEGTVDSASYSNLPIPDGIGNEQCGPWVTDSILVTELPPEAIVLTVDVFFQIEHSYPQDLVVDLCYIDCSFSMKENLWNRNGSGSYFYRANIDRWWGLPTNEFWKLRVKDCDIGLTGTLVMWALIIHYHIPPDPPPWVGAQTGFDPRHADVNWSTPTDPQYGGFIIRWHRVDTLLDRRECEGFQYINNPSTRYADIGSLYCGDTTHFMVNCYSIYGSIYEGMLPPRPRPGAPAYCTNVSIQGSQKYVNHDYELYIPPCEPDTIPLANVLVTFWDAVTGDSLPTHTYTIGGGYFGTYADRIDHVICAKFSLVNQDGSFSVREHDLPTKFIYVFSDTMGPDNLFDLLVDEDSLPPPSFSYVRFGEAAYSFYDLYWTKVRFGECCSWATPPVRVLYDWNNVVEVASSGDTGGYYWIHLTRTEDGYPQYRTGTPYHEYAHTIHRAAWDTTIGGCPLEHYPNSVTNGWCALVEGWANFIQCVIPDDQWFFLEYTDQDIESNEWWKGPNGQNKNGYIVEGAVASGWYDLQDENIDDPDEYHGGTYYNLDDQLDNIFRVFKDQKPHDMHKFVDYWRNDPQITGGEKSRLGKIFEKHHLVIPGDCTQDGVVGLGDLVFLISYVYKGGAPPVPLCIGDVNGDDVIDVGDVVYFISYCYKGGPPLQNGCI